MKICKSPKYSTFVIGTFFVSLFSSAEIPLAMKNKNKFLTKFLGATSFSLWTVTAASGRWIGFS